LPPRPPSQAASKKEVAASSSAEVAKTEVIAEDIPEVIAEVPSPAPDIASEPATDAVAVESVEPTGTGPEELSTPQDSASPAE
jgi:hypothetical protein